jgi:hypothetical protein
MGAAATARKKAPGRDAGRPGEAPASFTTPFQTGFTKTPRGIYVPRDERGRIDFTAVAPAAHLQELQLKITHAISDLQADAELRGVELECISHEQFAHWFQQSRRNVLQSIEALVHEKGLAGPGLIRRERTRRGYRYTVDWGKMYDLKPREPRKLKREKDKNPATSVNPEPIPAEVYCPECGALIDEVFARSDGKVVSLNGPCLHSHGRTVPVPDSTVVSTPPPSGGAGHGPSTLTFPRRQPVSGPDVNPSAHHRGTGPEACDVNPSAHHRGTGPEACDVNPSAHHKTGSSGEQKAKMQPSAAKAETAVPADPWLALKKKLAGRISQAGYDNWLARARFVSMEDGVLRVSVPSDATKQWLEEEYQDLIAGALEEIGLRDIAVVYDVRAADPHHTAPVAEPSLRDRLNALVPFEQVGEPLPDHLYERIEQRLGATPWPYLKAVITAKLHRLRSWAFISDHLVNDARLKWEQSGGGVKR